MIQEAVFCIKQITHTAIMIQEVVIMKSNNHVEHVLNKHASEARASRNGEYCLASCLHANFCHN